MKMDNFSTERKESQNALSTSVSAYHQTNPDRRQRHRMGVGDDMPVDSGACQRPYFGPSVYLQYGCANCLWRCVQRHLWYLRFFLRHFWVRLRV